MAPPSYEVLEETSDRSSAIRELETPTNPQPGDLELPEGFTADADVDELDALLGDEWDVKAQWHGPSPPGDSERCLLIFAVERAERRADPSRVKLVATCALS